MEYASATLDAAHRHSSNHKAELKRSDVCGCFYCRKTLATADVEEWIADKSGTAICPRCGVDAVIGSASGYPVGDERFLSAMYHQWFG